MTVGDMYSYILNYHREKMIQDDTRLAKNVIDTSDDLFNQRSRETSHKIENLVIPAPQEYSLFRSPKTGTPSADMFDLVRQELVSIQRDAEERLKDKDDEEFVSPDSMFNIGKKAKKDEQSGSPSANEKLFGTISLSFFPIAW
jgi:hypothetical protein